MMTHPSVWSPPSATDALLQSIVATARAIFASAAASVFVLDELTGDLVFRALAGAGASDLLGRRIPSDTGIAGWVVQTGQPMLVGDLAGSAVFSRTAAEATGYVPDSILAAPLLSGDCCLGVLEVLDPTADQRGHLADVDLLALFAEQATLALSAVQQLADPGGVPLERPWGSRWESALARVPAERAAAARELITAAEGLLGLNLEMIR